MFCLLYICWKQSRFYYWTSLTLQRHSDLFKYSFVTIEQVKFRLICFKSSAKIVDVVVVVFVSFFFTVNRWVRGKLTESNIG